jgi:GT2 family glycosyltransferase
MLADCHSSSYGPRVKRTEPDVSMKISDFSRSHLVGAIESVTHFSISGWAINLDDLRSSPEIELLINGNVVCELRMHLMHHELEGVLKLPSGTLAPAGFSMKLPLEACAPGNNTITMRCVSTSRNIGQPHTFAYRPSFLVCNDSMGFQKNRTIKARSKDVSSALIGGSKAQQPTAIAKPQVSAIILNRDGAECLQALLASWFRYNSIPSELIVIDHASCDDSHQVVQDWSARLNIRWVGLPANDSFSASSNLGAKLAKAPYLLFLNNDIVWVQDVLPSMLQTLQQSTQVAVGLKLLRHDGKSGNLSNLARAPVQHMGVRLTLSEHVYWPYECSPGNSTDHDELFSPQLMPAVTAAVMLMRASDFWRLGGFDERYFYGYEDVELCLKAIHSGHRRCQITCRNDLLALHRHGHSRLSGRQPDVTRKLTVNQQVFARQLGLWSKQAWWQSLIRQDRLLCGENLTVGIVYDDCPLTLSGDLAIDFRQVRQRHQRPQALLAHAKAQALAATLASAFSSARLLLYPRSAGWGDFSQAHLLWVLTPEWAYKSGSRLRHETGLRADCRGLAVIDAANADASALCAAVTESGTSVDEVYAAWPGAPVVWQNDAPHKLTQSCKRLFIAMHVDTTDRPAKVKARQQVFEQGRLLQQAAVSLGLLVWSETFSADATMAPPVAELVVHIWPSSATGVRRQQDDLQDALYVGWIAGGSGRGCTNKALQGFEICWSTEPLNHLRNAHPRPIRHRQVKVNLRSVQAALKSAINTVEQRIGRAFFAP